MRTGIKIRVLRINEQKPEERPKVMFKGSDAAYDICRKDIELGLAPKGFRFVTQTTNPDEQGYRTGFLDLTARAAALKTQ